jgi:rhodanese-related sulfurtransferase
MTKEVSHIKHLTPAEVKAEQESSNAIVLDVRSPEEYAQGHINDAINVPLAELSDYVAGLPKDKPMITYCMMKHPGDSRGEKAAALLREQGLDANVLGGGLPAWQQEGFEVTKTEKKA